MKTTTKFLLALSVSTLISGMTILFSFIETPKILGLLLIIISCIIIYFILKNNVNNHRQKINTNLINSTLGLILVFVDLSYNLYTKNSFGPFDYGMVFTGLFIILINNSKLNFFIKDKFLVNFTTYFLFVILLLYGFFLSGLPVILGLNQNENPLLIYMTYNSLHSAAFFANFIRPTTIYETTLNFDGFQVGVWYPCSGVESITVFVSAIIAFFIAAKETNWKKMITYSIIGIIFLYFMNILRILILLNVGHHYGIETMLFVHYNLGWIMFVIGMMVFWMLAFKDLEIKSK